ncbi:hypothetical protein OUZ56_021755 [Daphnia magna]|uniref:Uncharacterized protein n=1 Tax=Daphnia magna TaxID=35525 RepID=A0ABR0AUC4_9CRUS|nr:hypothetical protein OUZ56_021755 [Daphnia magna]
MWMIGSTLMKTASASPVVRRICEQEAEYAPPQEEDEVEEIVIYDHKDQNRLHRIFNQPWCPDNQRPESLAGQPVARSPDLSAHRGQAYQRISSQSPVVKWRVVITNLHH